MTAERVLSGIDNRRALALSSGAIAVDMETAGAAEAARRMGIPWLAVRAITDGLSDDMPIDFDALAGPDGDLVRSRIVVHVLGHPWKIPGLIRLGARSSRAAGNLARYLCALLPGLTGEPA